MGGTSTDVSLIQAGTPKVRPETSVGDLTVKSPSVDVRTVGAGGESLAHVPELTKALRVGPESAGAVLGPACHGKGGTRATVTDANAVLGYLPPTRERQKKVVPLFMTLSELDFLLLRSPRWRHEAQPCGSTHTRRRGRIVARRKHRRSRRGHPEAHKREHAGSLARCER